MRRILLLSLPLLVVVACGDDTRSPSTASSPDSRASALRAELDRLGVATPDPGAVRGLDDPLVELGNALFFDPILSGNRDVACATCHHPDHGTGDGLPLSIGVGGEGLGPDRVLGDDRDFVPRNAPDLFNRGSELWTTMFWDARVAGTSGYFHNPVDEELPRGLDSVLAAQAMFPPTSDDEMRGEDGENEIAMFEEEVDIWNALAERLRSEPSYAPLFEAAFPDREFETFSMVDAANAMAAFMTSAFVAVDTPLDRFIAGDNAALSPEALRGAELFYGQAGCVSCHTGPLLTDQESHVLCVPQIGPGKGLQLPLDPGTFLDSNHVLDRFAFRTPPLRNVALTAPYMHDGVYDDLRAAVEHHVRPTEMLEGYDGAHLPFGLGETVVDNAVMRGEMERRMAPELEAAAELDDEEIDALVVFLEALTDPASANLGHVVPDSVPSGLPVSGR